VASIAPSNTRTNVSQLLTPFALIDARRMRRNIVETQEGIAGIGAALRPHFKTHRTAHVAELQLGAGAVGLTIATGAQLSAVKREFDCPVLISSLLQADCSIARDLETACAGGGVMFSIDSERSIELLRSAVGPDVVPDVMIEVDVGCLRTGVHPSDCGDLARISSRLGCRVVGLFSYPGHSYIPGQASEASDQEQAALELGALELARVGFDPEHISAGSTPTIRFARSGVVTEYRPGTYVFGDRQQLALGAMERSQLALTVVATVVAMHGDRIVLDAGGKALGRDAPRWLSGYGELSCGSETVITRLYDHHAVVESYDGAPLGVGDRVSIIPNNSNSVMALLRSAWLSEDGELAEELVPQPDR
jgi:D-serine deaminase-like pyridoxal phosphate-dependent protein